MSVRTTRSGTHPRSFWRPPTPVEGNLIAKLLSTDFPGRREAAAQLDGSLVREVDEDGSLEFRIQAASPAPVKRRVPIEAEAQDKDGVVIHALLHVVNGRVTQLELYKEDSSAILQIPEAGEWELVQLD